ncbi:helix-turn-helix domain-containing protein [Agaribacter marinus]|uniref:Transcriptional regulator n=1 Tax=Agaribacter marinus TaxID=1431249 RepID=A0AA37SW74_9ALTE|nr:helix-turn-helix domain-containing protein [Agaribacter marinus]GLR70207.1 transcriptional regulator [Agaribacter marinus]
MTQLTLLGDQLRSHRKRLGMSQLALASVADSTSRYISFIETGRSRPGKAVLLKIAKALTLTLRDTNALLLSAGLPSIYVEPALDDEQMAPVKRLVKQVLEKHEPFPAWVIAPGLNFIDSNAAAEKIFPGIVNQAPEHMIHIWCSRETHLTEETRVETVFQLLDGLRSEAFHYPHPRLPGLISIAEQYAKGLSRPNDVNVDSPVLCPKLLIGDKEVNTLSTVMRFDKGTNITMAEIRIELVFPADDESEAVFRNMP